MVSEPASAAPQDLAQAVALLRRLEHVPTAHIDLFEKVSFAQWQARDKLGEAPVYPSLPAETASQMLAHGFYLIDFARLKLDPAALRQLWDELCAILGEFGELTEPVAGRLRRGLSNGKTSLADLGQAVFRGDHDALAGLARRLRVRQRLLSWLTTLLLRPFLAAAAERLAGHLDKFRAEHRLWPHPYCPVCGHEPFMAISRRPDGRREVECSLCATRWEVRAGRCVFCGNEDREVLKFFYYDLESPYRVYACGACRRYIKSVDERKLPSDWQPVLVAEDIATLYFDVLARRKRYLPPWSAGPGGKTRGTKRKAKEVMPT